MVSLSQNTYRILIGRRLDSYMGKFFATEKKLMSIILCRNSTAGTVVLIIGVGQTGLDFQMACQFIFCQTEC